jgi:cation:H+ antiporter
MILALLGVVLGLALLVAGGASLVRGATDVAGRMGISPMIVGLTIVGFGTSSPELFVNAMSALAGESNVAFGNVIGSNISNLALVLGVAAVIQPLVVQGQLVLREIPLLLLATTILCVMALDGPLRGLAPVIGLADAIVLMLLFGIFVYISVLDFARVRSSDELIDQIVESPIVEVKPEARFSWLLIILGFVLLFVGGELTIRNSVDLAAALGVSTTIIGLFVVAVGTSMPELVTSIIAATRGESDLAIGNVVGSNIFNTLMVLPVGAAIKSVPVPDGGITDLVVSWMLAAFLIVVFLIGKARLTRSTGVFLLLGYAGYAFFRLSAS